MNSDHSLKLFIQNIATQGSTIPLQERTLSESSAEELFPWNLDLDVSS